jgi:hypothetical protein
MSIPSQLSQYDQYVQEAASQTGLDPKLIYTVMYVEDGSGDPYVISSAGAVGLMQLEPSTFASLGGTDINDPEQNITLGAKYLKSLISQYGSDGDAVLKGLICYNRGPTGGDRFLRNNPDSWRDDDYLQLCRDRFSRMFGGDFDEYVGAAVGVGSGDGGGGSSHGWTGKGNPPWYKEGGWGRVVEKPKTSDTLWDYWDDESVFPESRKNWSIFHLRIGDVVLVIPPDFISVQQTNRRSNMQTTIRQKNSIKTGGNNIVTEVAMNLWFYGEDQINGFPMDAPEGGVYWMDGLRALIAQFKRCPFLPVENEFLNYTMGIYALAFANFSVSTVPGFPGLLSVQVIFYKWETGPLIGFDSEFYDKMIVYPIWRFHYQQMLQEPGKSLSSTYLKPVDLFALNGSGQKLKIGILDERFLQSVENLKKVRTEDEMYVDFPLGAEGQDGQFEVTGFNATFSNILAPISLDFVGEPTYQFLGSMDTWFEINIETMDPDVVTAFRELNERLIYYTQHYHNRYVSGYMKITNDLVNMMGTYYAVIDRITFSTVPDYPGLYQITMRFVSYDRTQSQEERLMGHSGVPVSQADWGHLPGQDPAHFFNIIQQEVQAERWLSQIPLYPDLELPTLNQMNGYTDVNGKQQKGVLEIINDWRKSKGLRELPFTKIKGTYGQVFCDPDFYIIYPDTSVYLDGGDEYDLLGKEFMSELKKYTYKTTVDKQAKDTPTTSTMYDATKMAHGGHPFIDAEKAMSELSKFREMALKGDYLRPSWKYAKGPDGKYNPENYTVDWIKSQQKPGSDDLLAMQMYDMFRYDRRGTLLRAFPTYCLVIIDEGQWVDARKMWDNYYMYHALIEATVTLDRKNPAHTAEIYLGNVYGALNYRTKPLFAIPEVNGKKEDNLWGALHLWYHAISPDLKSYESQFKYRVQLLDQGYLQAGARIHFRMGYGSNALDLPTVINGQIAELQHGDVVRIVVQGDGAELMNNQIDADATEVNTWYVEGTTAHAVIQHYMVTRGNWLKQVVFQDSEDLSYYLGRGSAYGIEHFGYVRMLRDPWSLKGWQGFMKDVDSVINGLFGWAMSGISNPNGDWGPGNIDPYDVMKNIYTTNEDYNATNRTGVGGIFDKENLQDHSWAIQTYLQNKTPWDVFKLLERESREFICYPVHHNFHSTLFFGKPHYYCKQGWVLADEKNPNVINSYRDFTKPFAQYHFYDAFMDIIHNGIKAVAPEFTNVIPLYSDGILHVGTPSPTKYPVFADRRIRPEMQKTKTINTTLVRRYIWTLLGIDIDKIARWAVDFWDWLTGQTNQVDDEAMQFGVSVLCDAFRDMYQGSMTVIGDPSVKPYDYLWINDSYNRMFGMTEAGIVTHYMSLDTGFVTDIKPDLVTIPLKANSDPNDPDGSLANNDKYKSIIRMAAISGAITLYFWRMRVGYDMYKAKRAQALAKEVSELSKDEKIGFIRYNLAYLGSFLKKPINLLKKIPMNSLRSWLIGLEARLAPEEAAAGMPGWIFLAIQTAVFAAITAVFDQVLWWFDLDKRSIQIIPLFYNGHPYVAGINGHKNLIPGYADEFIWGDTQYTEEGDVNKDSSAVVDDLASARDASITGVVFPVWMSGWSTADGGPANPTARYGDVNHLEGQSFHAGYDFPCPAGTPVRAVADGTVMFTWEDPSGFGHYMVVNHDDACATLYGHLSEFRATDGQRVHAGQIIALSGYSGAVDPPGPAGAHLHLGVLIPENGVLFSHISRAWELFANRIAPDQFQNFHYVDPWAWLINHNAQIVN